MIDTPANYVAVPRADLDQLIKAATAPWLSITRACEYADLSDDTIRKFIAGGQLTAHRPAKGKILISRAELDNLIRSSTARPRVGRGLS